MLSRHPRASSSLLQRRQIGHDILDLLRIEHRLVLPCGADADVADLLGEHGAQDVGGLRVTVAVEPLPETVNAPLPVELDPRITVPRVATPPATMFIAA